MKKFLLILMSFMLLALSACSVSINGKKVYSFDWGMEGELAEKTETIDVTVASQNKLDVSNVSGKIVLIPWEKNEIKITAVKKLRGSKDKLEDLFNDLKVNVEKENDTINISVKYINSILNLNFQNVDLELMIPEKFTNISVNSASGDIKATGFNRLEKFKIATTSGQVDAGNISAQEYELKATSGDMNLYGIKGSSDINTVSGSINMKDLSGKTVIRSTSGNLKADNFNGNIKFTSISGDISLNNSNISESSFKTTSGDISADTVRMENSGECSFTSVSGDVEIYLPENAGFMLEAKTISGDITNDFDIKSSGSYDNDDKNDKAVKQEFGSGGPQVKVKTTSGDISIKQR